ncbi:hypothetical protein [Thermococcus sp.]
MVPFELITAKWGEMELSDGTIVRFRVALVDAIPSEETTPFGTEFEVNIATGISVTPSPESIEEVKDKQIIPSGSSVEDGWKQVKIIKSDSAYEEVRYSNDKLGEYKIRVEIEPAMVSKNTKFKTAKGEPLYVVKWIPKLMWEKLSSGEET